MVAHSVSEQSFDDREIAMSKTIKAGMVAASVFAALAVSGAPAQAHAQANGITNCAAPGNQQQTGAVVGALVGGLAGNLISSRSSRGIGTVLGVGVGAAAGSYIGCNEQQASAGQQANPNMYRADAQLRIRSGPGRNYDQIGQLDAGQPFTAIGSEGEWVQIAGGGWVNARYVRHY